MTDNIYYTDINAIEEAMKALEALQTPIEGIKASNLRPELLEAVRGLQRSWAILRNELGESRDYELGRWLANQVAEMGLDEPEEIFSLDEDTARTPANELDVSYRWLGRTLTRVESGHALQNEYESAPYIGSNVARRVVEVLAADSDRFEWVKESVARSRQH